MKKDEKQEEEQIGSFGGNPSGKRVDYDFERDKGLVNAVEKEDSKIGDE